MITLVIAFCATAALTDCKPDQRMVLPPSTTMEDCDIIRQMMLLEDDAGRRVIAGKHKRISCEL